MRPLPTPAAIRSAGLTAILLLALGSTAAAPVARSVATGSVGTTPMSWPSRSTSPP